jgi:signal transduction histidine kinase
VQILKGSIQVNSLEGVGTTFIISLPNQLDEISFETPEIDNATE